MSSENRGTFGVVCFLAGAAIGAGLALLYAPQSGAETRKKIKDVSNKVSDDIKDHYEKISDEAKKSIQQVKVHADKAIDNVKNFFEGAKDGLKKELRAEMDDREDMRKG